MEKPQRSSFENVVIGVFIFFGLIAGLVLLGNFLNHKKTAPLQTQSGCISTAQAQIEANPTYYNTVAVGLNPVGLTLSGQIVLNTAINNCESEYPTN